MGGICSTHKLRKKCIKIVVGKPEGKRALERSRRKWEDNIRMTLRERGCEDVEWIHLVQDRD
jgi:hypothetical protein